MRKLIIGVVVVGVLAVAVYGGRRVYYSWKTAHAVKVARAAYEKGDLQQQLLWVRKALQADPKNVEAVRMMGDIASGARWPNAVYWRNRLVNLQPHSFTNRMLLAETALLERDFAAVREALEGVEPQAKNSAYYHRISGTYAMATGQFAQAEKHFTEAKRLEPQNPAPQVMLAMIQMHRSDPQVSSQGRRTLEALRTNAVVRADALRYLIVDAAAQTNYSRALAFSADLLKDPHSTLNDQLVELNLLRRAKHPEFPARLSAVQQGCATNTANAYSLARWMLDSGDAQGTLAWLGQVKPEIRTNVPVTIALADAYMHTSNWVALAQHVSTQGWGELEYTRLALHARALREQNQAELSKTEWAKAMKLAEKRLDSLRALEIVTTAWKWPAETEQVLWTTVEKFPAERAAKERLSNMLHITGKTRSLLTLYAQEVKIEPDNMALKNNLAAIALLLNAQEHRPHDLAREVYEKQKDNPAFASTYAYSLHLQNKTAEALRVMEQLKPAALEYPSIAAYYGMMLAASGDTTKAKKYLELSAKGRLLPEESEMVRRIRL